MKRKLMKHFIYALTGMFLVASFAGLVGGTVAWYAYNTRVALTYEGASVSNAERIQIGLKSETDFTKDIHGDDLGFGLTKQVVEGESYDYYWANPGSGFSAAAIGAYLAQTGFATNTLEPVTTREYIRGTSPFKLWKAPTAYDPAIENDANPAAYCKIDFVFRVLLTTSSVIPVYSANQYIWLSDCVAAVSGTDPNRINHALRLYFDDGTTNTKFIFNPTDEGNGGTTNVSGCLDLNMDGFYDFDGNGYEIIYGDYNEALSDMKASAVTFAAGDIPDEGDCNDINGVKPNGDPWTEVVTAEHSTFLARHTAGKKGYTKTIFDTRDTQYAEHFGKNKVKPADDGAGHLTGGMPICQTSSLATGAIGSTSMYIYIEGWDFAVIDKEVGHSFNLGLQFQIDRG